MRIAHMASGMGMGQASFRYRMLIPGAELHKRGHHLTLVRDSGPDAAPERCDVALFMKHYDARDAQLAEKVKSQGARVVFDVCDDHFKNEKLAPHYRAMLELCDVATTCSTEMAYVVRREAPNKRVEIIPDPFEYEELPPHAQDAKRLVWYGHPSNAAEIAPLLYSLREWELTLITGAGMPIAVTPWTPLTMRQVCSRSNIALLPSKKTTASANRVVEAIRLGLFVVCSSIPTSYAPFDAFGFVWADVLEGLKWASENKDALNARVQDAQHYVRETFAPEKVANQWEEVFRT